MVDPTPEPIPPARRYVADLPFLRNLLDEVFAPR